MKIIFYGQDGEAAIDRGAKLRTAKHPIRILHAEVTNAAEPCDGIEFMPDVSDFDRKRLTALFGGEEVPEVGGAGSNHGNALHVGKKDDGKFYILNADESIHSGPFAKKPDANAALKKELGA